MAKYIENNREQMLFVAGSLDSLLPADSVARGIWRGLERLDFRRFDGKYRNDDTGRPAVDPRRLAGVWMLALVRQVRSSVVVAKLCRTDVEFRWILGDAPVQKSTLCEFRKAQDEGLEELSAQVLTALVGCGMVSGESLGIDGTMVQAAAGRKSHRSRKNIQKEMDKLKKLIEERWSQEKAEEKEEADNLPRKDDPLNKRMRRLEQALEQMEEMGRQEMTITEPEAKLRQMKNGTFRPGYNVQVVSDLASGVIVQGEVSQSGNDKGHLEKLIRQAADEIKKRKREEDDWGALGPLRRVAADAEYHETGPMIRLEADGVQTYISDKEKKNWKPKGVGEGFAAEAFQYDCQTDTMICPAGQILRKVRLINGKTTAQYQGKASVCQQCEHRSECCPKSKTGRTVNRSIYEKELQEIAERVASDQGRLWNRARRVCVEGTIGRLKERLSWSRCGMWGLKGAQKEFTWRQLTHNLLLLTEVWKPLVYSGVKT